MRQEAFNVRKLAHIRQPVQIQAVQPCAEERAVLDHPDGGGQGDAVEAFQRRVVRVDHVPILLRLRVGEEIVGVGAALAVAQGGERIGPDDLDALRDGDGLHIRAALKGALRDLLQAAGNRDIDQAGEAECAAAHGLQAADVRLPQTQTPIESVPAHGAQGGGQIQRGDQERCKGSFHALFLLLFFFGSTVSRKPPQIPKRALAARIRPERLT